MSSPGSKSRSPRDKAKGKEPARPSGVVSTAEARRQAIAAKQRTILATESLVDTLAEDPRRAFQSPSARIPRRSFDNPDPLWQHTFDIGSPDFKKIAAATNSDNACIRQMFQAMFQNKLEIPDEDRWQPGKPLGHGSYGAAAMFKHVNETAKTMM
jgi:hypothetical protein